MVNEQKLDLKYGQMIYGYLVLKCGYGLWVRKMDNCWHGLKNGFGPLAKKNGIGYEWVLGFDLNGELDIYTK